MTEAEAPEPREIDPAPLFARIVAERTSDAGRAAVTIAANLYSRAFDPEDRAEARQWVKLGIDLDKAVEDGNLREALEKAKKKATTAAKLDRMKQLAAGNVIPISGGT